MTLSKTKPLSLRASASSGSSGAPSTPSSALSRSWRSPATAGVVFREDASALERRLLREVEGVESSTHLSESEAISAD